MNKKRLKKSAILNVRKNVKIVKKSVKENAIVTKIEVEIVQQDVIDQMIVLEVVTEAMIVVDITDRFQNETRFLINDRNFLKKIND